MPAMPPSESDEADVPEMAILRFLESLDCNIEPRSTHIPSEPKAHIGSDSYNQGANASLMPPGPNSLGSLDVLPTEILLMTAELLPLDALAALSITSRGLYRILGKRYGELRRAKKPSDTEYMSYLRRDCESLLDAEYSSYLQMLSQVVSESFFCQRCRRLHILVPSGGWSIRLTDAERCDKIHSVPCMTGRWIMHISMAVKLRQYTSAACANSYMTHLSRKFPLQRMTFLPTYRGFIVHEPQFIEDQLYVRNQYWTFIQRIPGMESSTIPFEHDYLDCYHIDITTKNEDKLAPILRCRFSHLGSKEDSCTFCQRLIQCDSCFTEVIVDTVTDPLRGKAVVVTEWQACGPSWTYDRYYRWYTLPVRERDSPGLPGSIRAVFETQPVVRYNAIFEASRAWDLMTELSDCYRQIGYTRQPCCRRF